MEANGGQKEAECYDKRYFGGSKGAALEIRKAWQERGRRQGSRLVTPNMGQGAMGLGMLGRRQMMPRCDNDTVWLHAGSRRESGQGRVRAPPPPEGNQAESGEGRSGLRRME